MVVVVVAIMASLTVLSVGGNEAREFRRDIARLQTLLELARDEAFTEGVELGWQLDETGDTYRFYVFDSKQLQWQLYERKALTERQLSGDYRFLLNLQGQVLDLVQLHQEKRKNGDDYQSIIGKTEQSQESIKPDLLFFSDGSYSPFTLKLQHSTLQELQGSVGGDGINEILVQEHER